MSASAAIQTQGQTKSYGALQALCGVDLEVRRGEIFGFLGLTGSGKTTTIAPSFAMRCCAGAGKSSAEDWRWQRWRCWSRRCMTQAGSSSAAKKTAFCRRNVRQMACTTGNLGG
jgi:ABC-type dipeptide/oligopeptide/nickel transport system ATPase component